MGGWRDEERGEEEEEVRKWADPGEYETKSVANKEKHVEISQKRDL